MAELGLVGARRQSLRFFANGVVFKRRFGESPVTLQDNVILGMCGQIRMDGNCFICLEPESAAPEPNH
jgi:hypothetical protein